MRGQQLIPLFQVWGSREVFLRCVVVIFGQVMLNAAATFYKYYRGGYLGKSQNMLLFA
jgi:hypothetical protein